MTEKEKFENDILERLKTISNECDARGIAFLAVMGFETDISYLLAQRLKMTFAFELVAWAVKANGNIDKLFLAVKKYAKKHGHTSVFLRLLEINEK